MAPFEDIFDYQLKLNQKLHTELEGYDEVLPPKAHLLFSHVLNAHHIWNARIQATSASYHLNDLHEMGAIPAIILDNHAHTLEILSNREMDELISYTNSKGEPFENSVRDILFHISNHTTHHRAQIMSLFRHHGVPPLVTDYIEYKR